MRLGAGRQASCEKPVYLTFDTGHMGVAPLVAEVLKRQDVRVTFFAAAERTTTDGDSLDNHWAPGGRRGRPRAMSSPRTPTTTPTGAPT
jgi:peptidoglycan/xylan/chitin deacetylase (PgdA/CDA1 family)